MKTIPLSQGKVALVDDADFERVNAFKWCAHKVGKRFYAARGVRSPDGKWGIQHMHQFLLSGVPRVDHRDGDGLNNQRHNLRAATAQQNLQGFRRKRAGATSKFRGVSWSSRLLKWVAEIQVNGRRFFLGTFTDEKKAARAYDTAAIKYFGDFACPNFP